MTSEKPNFIQKENQLLEDLYFYHISFLKIVRKRY